MNKILSRTGVIFNKNPCEIKISVISVICLWLILSRLNIVKASSHSVFAAPEYLCDIFNCLGSTNARKIRFLRVFRGLLLDDDAEGGAVMGFGGFDEDAFLSTTKVESMV